MKLSLLYFAAGTVLGFIGLCLPWPYMFIVINWGIIFILISVLYGTYISCKE